MLTGDRPTGVLHLGHYFGRSGSACGCRRRRRDVRVIADYQVITDREVNRRRRDATSSTPVARLSCRRHRPGPDHRVRALGRTRTRPAHAAVPEPGHRGRTAPQPDGEGRTGRLRAQLLRAAAHLSGAPGRRHPVLQGEPGAGGRGQRCRTSSRPAWSPGASTSGTARLPRSRKCSSPPPPNCPAPTAQDVQELRQRDRPGRDRGRDRAAASGARADTDRHITFDPGARPGVSTLLTTAARCAPEARRNSWPTRSATPARAGSRGS